MSAPPGLYPKPPYPPYKSNPCCVKSPADPPPRLSRAGARETGAHDCFFQFVSNCFIKQDAAASQRSSLLRRLLNWAPLSAWVGAVASDDDAIEDAADDDAAMRKAKTLARLQKSF